MENEIAIMNYAQACAYVANGVQPIRLEYNAEKDRMVYIFATESTKEVWELWKRGKLFFKKPKHLRQQ